MKIIFAIMLALVILTSCDSDVERVQSYYSVERYFEKRISIIESQIEHLENKDEEIITKTNDLVDYIAGLEQGLLRLDYLNCRTIYEMQDPLNSNLSGYFIFNSKNRHYHFFKQNINSYTNYLVERASDENDQFVYKKLLSTNDVRFIDYTRSWESIMFEHVPLIEAILNLKRIEFDIRTAELMALTHLKNQDLDYE